MTKYVLKDAYKTGVQTYSSPYYLDFEKDLNLLYFEDSEKDLNGFGKDFDGFGKDFDGF